MNSFERKEQTAEPTQAQEYVIRPFIQTPDAEIKIARGLPEDRRWAEKWGRTCGNPATSIVAKR